MSARRLSSLFRFAIGSLLAVAPAMAAAQGQLDQLRNDVRGRPPAKPAAPESPAPPKSYSSDPDSLSDEDDVVGELLAPVVIGAMRAPFLLPRLLADDHWDRHGYFPRYPYDDESGYMVFAPYQCVERFDWSLLAELHTGSDFDGLDRYGGRLLYETTFRLGIDAEFNGWEEEEGAIHDELWQGDVNLVLRFAQSPKLRWRAGLGMNWLADQDGTDYGFNVTYGADFFPRDPWVITGTIDIGSLGHSGYFHGQATLGAVFRGWEPFVGVDLLRTRDTELNLLLAGVRFW